MDEFECEGGRWCRDDGGGEELVHCFVVGGVGGVMEKGGEGCVGVCYLLVRKRGGKGCEGKQTA